MDRRVLIWLLWAVTLTAAADCEGVKVHFTQQVSEQVAEDELVAHLSAQRQAATLVALNRQLNEISRQVAKLRAALPASVRLETESWRSWPVYDKARVKVLRWRGQVRYRLIGPLGDETAQAVQRLQSGLLLERMTPRVSEPRRSQARAALEAELLRAARARLEGVSRAMGARKARFDTINLEAQARAVGPRPMMVRAMQAMDMPAPAVEGGQQRVQVTGRFSGCLLR